MSTINPNGAIADHLAPRTAKKSDDYVAGIVEAQERLATATGRKTATREEKQRRLAGILADKDNYMVRLGQGMIGPIQLKLRYQGMTRNVLLEDPLTPGVPVMYLSLIHI